MCDEPLVPLPMERWPELKDVFKRDWPRGICGYGVLDIEELMINNGADYGFKAYVPYGDMCNGLVGINVKGNFFELIIQPTKEVTTDLVNALKHTKLINWKSPIELAFSRIDVADTFKSILHEKRLFIKGITTTETFYIEDDAPYFDVELPPELTFEMMTDKHASISNDTWPHKYSGSIWYYQLLIKAKLGYGLFQNGELVAWCYVKEMGALGHLYTLEAHRRKGYGELVLKLISNTLRREGRVVFAFCVAGNVAARNLYSKLGFTSSGDLKWCHTKPIVE
ncbi:unnamed protein product [Pieris macdunnoughi]|uniref:N-acetyltransferase domain-containing protein n=1 Tax=Pieris macdunnoughi TaxID=345717 RepID=A0A821PW45_9NEOP|nr:unnamed protein product [Pieris macdunnoughi]